MIVQPTFHVVPMNYNFRSADVQRAVWSEFKNQTDLIEICLYIGTN